MRLRFSDVKSTLAKVLNLSSSDSRVIEYCNRACERLLYSGKAVDTYARYSVCVSDNCLTWPRDIETIEHVAICDRPGVVRNGFYEFLENGPGLISDNCGPSLTLADRGNAVTFDDITTTGYTLAIYADGTEEAGNVLIRYYNSSGQKVYTGSGSSTIEGENFAIPAAGNYTVSAVPTEVLPYGIYHVSKPITRRPIRLYAQKISDGTRFPLAYYEPDEDVPVYRRSYVTDLGGSTGSDCDTTSVTVIGKLRFIPARVDSSVLIISHLDAIRLACQAIKKEEDNLMGEAAKYWDMAKMCLSEQIQHWQGDGVVAPIRITGNEQFGPSVFNMV